MILRSLKVLRFGHLNPGAAIPRFAEGVTVIHGPNETGKSTLLRGLTYALYQRHGVAGERVEDEIVPIGLKLTPSVEIVFDHGGRTYRLRKQFHKRPSASLEVLRPSALLEEVPGGEFSPVADGADADEALREMLGAAFPGKGVAGADLRGLGEILIVDQGALRFAKGLGDRARESLRGVIEDVGTTASAHGILKSVRDRYLEVHTPTGTYKKGCELLRLQEEQARVRAALGAIQERLQRAAELEDLLTVDDSAGRDDDLTAKALEEDVQKARRDEVEHQRRKSESELAARVASERRREADIARKRCDDLARAAADRVAAEREHEEAAQDFVRRQDERARQEVELRRAEEDSRRREGERKDHEQRREAITGARRARAAAKAAAEADARLLRHAETAAAVQALEQELAAKPRPTRELVAGIRRRLDRRAALDRDLEALHLRVRLVAERELEIDRGGIRQVVPAGTETVIGGTDPLDFSLPGIARLSVSGPPVAARAELIEERTRIDREVREQTAPFRTEDLSRIEILEAERIEIERALGLRRATMTEIFPRERDRAEAERVRSEESAVLRSLLESHPEWGEEPPSEAHIAGLEQVFRDVVERFDAGQAEGVRLVDERRKLRDEAAAALDVQQTAANNKRARLNTIDGTLRALRDDGLEDRAREERAQGLGDAARAAEAEGGRLADSLAALGDPAIAVRRAEDARRQHVEGIRRRSEERGGHLRELEMLRGQGLWSEAGRLEEKDEELSSRLDRAQSDARALKLLQDILVEEQQRSVEAVLAPVSEKVRRLAQAVFGPSARPKLGEALVPAGLEIEGRGVLGLPQLSAGAHDQLALLTRLAFGELQSRKGGRHLFVLDDPLVNCDRDRRVRVLDILIRATKDLQIVILTCHPEHYLGLPEDRALKISIDEARKAFRDEAPAAGFESLA